MRYRDRTIENIERQEKKLPLIHCPFDCEGRDVDPKHGYCCHLVGFSNDGQTYERIEPMTVLDRDEDGRVRKDDEGNSLFRENGEFRTTFRNKQRILKSDVIINPVSLQKTNEGTKAMRKWVSARVYREVGDVEAAEWRKKYAHPEDMDLADQIAAESVEDRKQRLREELAELEADQPSSIPDLPSEAEIEAANEGEPDESLAEAIKKKSKKREPAAT